MRPFHELMVPHTPTGDPFVGRFCKCGRGHTGIVMGWMLVRDTRPDRQDFARLLYYGVSYITGKRWQTFNPKPLGVAELQSITWAWGGKVAAG